VLRDEEGPGTWFGHVDPERERAGRAALEDDPRRAPSSVARALRTGRVVTSRPPDAGWPAEVRDAGPGALEATLPLAGVGEPLGTLTLLAPADSRLGSPEGIVLAEELARRLAIAIDNARLYATAEQAVRARDDFLAIASHELKTPLTPLRIQIQTLERLVRRGELDGISPERLAKLVGGADGQIVRIVGLIDRLLDLTRIRAKRFRLDLAPMDLSAAVRAIVEQHAAEIRQAGCRLSVEAAGPVQGTWDRLRVEQVVANLLTNAAKYAPGTFVEVRVKQDDRRALLEVRDEGPGIPALEQERVFRPFERARSSSGASGLGLGLYIVRQIVEAHGGAVSLRSAPGKGTSFLVELPCAAAGR
jgi:signal transduction histidine kinase